MVQTDMHKYSYRGILLIWFEVSKLFQISLEPLSIIPSLFIRFVYQQAMLFPKVLNTYWFMGELHEHLTPHKLHFKQDWHLLSYLLRYGLKRYM